MQIKITVSEHSRYRAGLILETDEDLFTGQIWLSEEDNIIDDITGFRPAWLEQHVKHVAKLLADYVDWKPVPIPLLEFHWHHERGETTAEFRNLLTQQTVAEFNDAELDDLLESGFITQKCWILGKLQPEQLRIELLEYLKDKALVK